MVGLSAPKAPKEWENLDRLMKELLLNETKDPRKIFAQCPKLLPITYEELFSQGVKEVTWKKLEDEKEDKEVQAYADLLHSDEFQYEGRKKKNFIYRSFCNNNVNVTPTEADPGKRKGKERKMRCK